MKANEKRDSRVILTVAVIFLLVAVLVVMILLLLQMRSNSTQSGYAASVTDAERTGRVQYATEGVTIVDDQNAIQKAAEEIFNAPDDTIGLTYKNDAYSSDGQNFDCLIANSDMNTYDAFFTICADDAMTDELYVSGLLRPGQAFEKIRLEHPLESGNHTVYVTIALVDEVDGEQTIVNHMTYTMDFHVG